MKCKSVIVTFFALIVAAGPITAADDTNATTSTEAADTAEPALVGDVAAGKKLYRRNCRACHGATAKGASSYPRLVGHPTEYLIDKLERYRAGEKFGPNTPLMAQRVKTLTDQDFANVSAFIVSLEGS